MRRRPSAALPPCAGRALGAALLALACGGSARGTAAADRATGAPAAAASVTPASAVLDELDAIDGWSTLASDGVLATARLVPGLAGRAVRLDFDFQGHGGHLGLRRALPLRLPGNYEISFYVRGDAPPNDLQFKLVDDSGDNVWWYRQRDLAVTAGWQRIAFKKRQVEFAWGPTHDRQLERAASLELVLAAGQGGKGSLEIDRLSLRELPPPPAQLPPPVATASSNSALAALALDGRADTAWRSAAAAPASATESPTSAAFELDLGLEREFGGLVLRWAEAPATRYDVELSSDHATWRTVRRVRDGNGGRDALLLPESEARYVRLSLHGGTAAGYALAEVDVKDLAFGATPNAFIAALAREAPRGRYPRAFVGEQPYWTLVGVDGGSDSGLLSEDGALEVGRGRFAVEPFVRVGDELFSWADVAIEQRLREGYLPIPSVSWRRPDWELRVTAFAGGDSSHAQLWARYELTNRSPRPLALELLLAVRPLQVNPPTQFLNQAGGYTPIRQLAWSAGSLSVNGAPALWSSTTPGRVTLASFDAGDFPERIPPARPEPVDDSVGMASALLAYPVQLAPGSSATLGVAAPLIGAPSQAAASTEPAALRSAEEAVAARWHGALDRVQLAVPAEGRPLVETLRTSLAHILMSRDGVMLRPGTRSYARSWIRDGAMMSECLLRLGQEQAAASYFDWYAPHQFDGGKVPCCVDARGADPVPEHDSAGELIFLAAELYRYTADRARLERSWPHVASAAGYLEGLRQSQRTTANLAPERRALYGLLPPSISHEGYSDKPAYSYWDDFWGLIGYQDAAWLAEVLGDPRAGALGQQRDEFRRELHASLRAVAARQGLSFLPGAADRGDFDATSTTIALAPGREQAQLPPDLLLGTFERYWQDFSARRSGGKEWDAYTPYELRVAGTFIRLGWRERARVLFDFFMADRRPQAWNQWAEVVGREPRQPRFVGDMPHAWISSDYIRAVLDMFAYARPADQSLVLAAGIPASWLDGEGVSVKGLRTVYGLLDFTLGRSGRQIALVLAGSAPPGGFVLPWPWPGTPADAPVTIDGKPARWGDGELR
ncbi:MAG TPA: discoidin domain-containing protein, partial [Polyangiaceae bacterium]|nr:discoidin domain-containing protein [Polyangiaceae bacterium]